MAAAVLGISAFGSVPVTAAESTETADIGEAMAMDGEAVSSDLVAGTFKPSDVTCKAQDSYEYPFLGLKLSLSKELLNQIKDQSIAMLTTEDFENQTNAVTYAYVSWSKMTEEQKNAEIQKMGTGSVSYTHLDVYKRQVQKQAAFCEQRIQSRPEIFFRGGDYDRNTEKTASADYDIRSFRDLFYRISPVSYTHLDVYKRQV